jgi:rhodanese-related sulfurtransferase
MTTTTIPGRVDATVIQEWMTTNEPFTILDVRTPAEFESVHIPGAYNVPLDLVGEHRDELRRHLHQEPVVLVCRSGVRAAQAEQRLAEAGMENVRVLEGGISAWEAAGAPVRRGTQRWDIERQVRLVAGTLVLAGVLGSLVFKPLKFLSAAVGAGLAFAALTNTCAMGNCLARLPYNRAATCDIDAVIDRLAGKRAA